MKVGLVAVGKLENHYIREYVKYYKELGIDTIFLGDNNDEDGEHFEDVINDFISEGFVKLTNLRNNKTVQFSFYKNIYKLYSKEYDWFCFFDIDEFLFLDNFKNIKEYLNQTVFNYYDVIHINWKCYDDNDLLYYEDKPVLERFTREMYLNNTFPNKHVKSIVRGKNTFSNLIFHTPHTIYNNNVKSCDCEGNHHDNGHFLSPPNYNGAHIKHFIYKTIEECINIKIKRGYPDQIVSSNHFNNMINKFFIYNKKTPEKLTIVDKYRK